MKNPLNQLDLPDTYRTHHSTTAEYTFSTVDMKGPTTWIILSGHKTNLNKFIKTEILQSMEKSIKKKPEITKIRNERDITGFIEIKRIIRIL